MALRGRAAKWIGGGARRASISPLVGGTVIGGAALGGGVAGVLDEEGPYAQLQEDIMGDRNALRYSLKAGIGAALRPDDNLYGRGDYYYGQRVNSRSPRTQPVSGDVVLGMYNLRR